MVKEFNDKFMQIAPTTLLYRERYQIVDQRFIDETTKTIREYYFGQNNIDESDEARFNVIDVSSNNKIILCNIYIKYKIFKYTYFTFN